MTDKELIKQEIESCKESMKGLEPHSDFRRGQITAYNQIMQFINSLPEEPVKKELGDEIDRYLSSDDFELSEKAGTGMAYADIARHFAKWGRNHFEDKSEMVSEDLEEASIAYSCANPSERSDGMYDQTDIEWAFEAGAEWQIQKDQETIELAEDHAMLAGMNKMKEEMMKDAVEGLVGGHTDIPAFINLEIEHKPNVKVGDKVKIIILKTE